ncbi:hypothetical protein VDG1235_3807 [Verrucomicrobiia bacterium DG1235]|nr:hypothetical protein VDG1235_3807 [Verrucomicrobiae bacterium DG1235]
MRLRTARRHFTEDIKRSKAIFEHARHVPNKSLQGDLLRSSFMFSVGALDAFFCDAFGDLVSRTLSALEKEPIATIMDNFENLSVPAVVLLKNAPTDGWRWRMAARAMIEKENVLSITQIKKLFNRFFEDSEKLFCDNRLEGWMTHGRATNRVFGIARSDFLHLSGTDRISAIKNGNKQLNSRYKVLFQRRHDCIHNCDRPKVAPQAIARIGSIKNMINDIEFLVDRCHDELYSEFPRFLNRCGFSAVTRNQVGASR